MSSPTPEYTPSASTFRVKGWTELEAMNALQDCGIISDNAVWWEDVGNQDEAIAWLARRLPDIP